MGNWNKCKGGTSQHWAPPHYCYSQMRDSKMKTSEKYFNKKVEFRTGSGSNNLLEWLLTHLYFTLKRDLKVGLTGLMISWMLSRKFGTFKKWESKVGFSNQSSHSTKVEFRTFISTIMLMHLKGWTPHLAKVSYRNRQIDSKCFHT